MSRKKFVCDPSVPYHVTGRCINKEWFCHPDIAWSIFSRQLWFVSFAFNFRIHAFVLMPNHFHLIVSCPDANLSRGMQWLMGETSRSMTKASNRINETYGERFHRTRIGNSHYFMQCYKYVYFNPKKAGIIDKVETYKYSSLGSVLGFRKIEFPIYDTFMTESHNIDHALKWLNANPTQGDWDSIRLALRKPDFRIARQNSRLSHLEMHFI